MSSSEKKTVLCLFEQRKAGTCNSGASCEFSHDIPKSRGDSQPSGGQPPGKGKGNDKKNAGPQKPSAGMAAAMAGATGAATADGLQAPDTAAGTDTEAESRNQARSEAAKTLRPEITKRHNGYGALSSLTTAVAHLYVRPLPSKMSATGLLSAH